MPPKLNKSKEYLDKRKLAQRLCKQRRYAKIKNDPELLEIAKQKRRVLYQKQKEANKYKLLRGHRAAEQRKKWKENSKRYRQRKKELADKQRQNESVFEPINIQVKEEPCSSKHTATEEPDVQQIQDPLYYHTPQIKKEIRRIRYTELKKRKQLMRTIAAYEKRDKTQRKLIQRLKEKLTKLRDEQSEAESDSSSSKGKEEPTVEYVTNFYTYDKNMKMCADKKEYTTRNKVKYFNIIFK